MAEENPCSMQEKKLLDFPPVNLLDALISSFPKEWRGIFAALNSEHLPVQAASFWLQKKSANERLSDIPPNFIDLIDHIVKDFPVVLNDKLFFKPKILFLPLNIQRNTLAFIAYHSSSVPVESLEKLVHCLGKFTVELEGWRLTHLKILESKAIHLKESDRGSLQKKEQRNDKENNLLCTDLITEESRDRFDKLIEKNKFAESTKNISWFSSVFDSQMLGHNANENTAEQQKKEGGRCDVDMIDLTDTRTHDTNLRSDKTLQGIHSGFSDAFVQSDIEIIEDTENPAKQIKLEHDAHAMTELTVPLPPEHFIIGNGDVPEDLINNAEDVPEHLIINNKDFPEQITGEEVTANVTLSDAVQQKICALKDLLQSSEINEINFSSELEAFSSCSSLEMECICTQLNLESIQESSAISLCQQFVVLPTEPSFGNAAVFARYVLLPKIQGLKQAASRVLFSAVSQFAKKHSRAFCDGVVIRLIQQSDLDTPQVDLINKIVKECLREDTRIHLLQLILSIKTNNEGCPFSWTENTVSVVQMLVDLKPELSSHLFETLASVLEVQSCHLSKSLKYAKMLLAVIKTYGQQVSLHLNSFVCILEGNKTFLKKAGLSALKKTAKN